MRKSSNHRFTATTLAGCMAFSAGKASADSLVVGGTGLLNQAGANSLATYLGEGDLTLTNVFTHSASDGKTSSQFHSGADGQGRTFAVIEVTAIDGNAASAIIGGYDPQSWNSSGTYNIASADINRTAFLFNLTTPTQFNEKLGTLDGSAGQYQTRNVAAEGPSFGGGVDLYITSGLTTGYTYNYSYGATAQGGTTILGSSFGSGLHNLTYGRLDVFTIADGVPTPLPKTALGGLVLLGGVGLLQFRRGTAPIVR